MNEEWRSMQLKLEQHQIAKEKVQQIQGEMRIIEQELIKFALDKKLYHCLTLNFSRLGRELYR